MTLPGPKNWCRIFSFTSRSEWKHLVVTSSLSAYLAVAVKYKVIDPGFELQGKAL